MISLSQAASGSVVHTFDRVQYILSIVHLPSFRRLEFDAPPCALMRLSCAEGDTAQSDPSSSAAARLLVEKLERCVARLDRAPGRGVPVRVAATLVREERVKDDVLVALRGRLVQDR
jgi:hypothetical protein